jgi:hypothetical protein
MPVDRLARYRLGFDRHGELEAELEKELEEDILFGAIGFHVLDRIEERLRQIFTVRVPGADVRGVELEDAEAEIHSAG